MKNLVRSKIEKVKAEWYIWLFPLIALGISGWFLYDYYKQQGPRIHIYFEDAGGIQAEKTTVRFRGVAVGTVKDVYISDNQKDVIADVLLRKDAGSFAVEGSKFSLVTPKVNFQGVTGLQTILEGTFIAAVPGPSEGPVTHEFKAQATLGTDAPEDTSAYLIQSESAESITAGDSVTYRGVKVGTVSKLHFAKGAQMINIQINIDNRYTHLIRDNTVFWRKVGIQAKLGLFSSEVKVNSLESVMNGGVELATPNPPGPRAKALQKFTLATQAPKDQGKWKPLLE